MATREYDQVIQGVELVAGVDRAAAERVVRATLATLAERLGREAFLQLATELPEELRQLPAEAATEPAAFPPEEFVRRAAHRAGIDQDRAWTQTRAVLATLREQVAQIQELGQRLAGYSSLLA